jgi:glycosyltransferase involved in cell wall biosynthesis
MKIGYFTSIEGWGGSEMYLLRLMLGVRELGHEVVLFGVAGTRLWDEAAAVGIERVAWRSILAADCRPQTTDRFGKAESRSSFARAPADEKQKAEKSGTKDEINHKDHREHKDETVGCGGIGEIGDPRSLRSAVCGLQSGVKRAVLRLTPDLLKLLVGNLREVLHLRPLFKAHPVDVMHVSNSGYEVAGLACRGIGIPTIVMNMITPPEGETFIRRMLMIYTMRRYDHVSSQSEYCTEQWRRMAGIPKVRTSFVWNGTDLNRFQPCHREKQTGEPFRIVSLGRLHHMKGYKYLIQAMNMMEKCDLTIYGEGEEREDLERLIRVLGVGDRVHLPGHTEDPIEALQHADCFVLPSVSHESCPAVLAQAMACGLPLITCDFGPLAEVNVAGVTGFVCQTGSSVELEKAILELVGNSELALRLGMNGRVRAVESFEIVSMIEKMEKCYAKLCKANSESR